MAEHAFDTSAQRFAEEVIEASKTVPVVVDFWAPWCAPCRALKPVLEKLASEYQGKFKLAKLNIDEHQQIAARYDVRGIPNVKAFVDGALAKEFSGALPESAVRQFIEAIIPSPAQQLRHAALENVRAGELAVAEAKLREALALDEGLHAARVDLAELLFAREDLDAAARELTAVPEHERDEAAQLLAAKVALAQRTSSLPDLARLREAVALRPADFQARIALAERFAAQSDFRAALEQLISVVEADRSEPREMARKRMLEVFRLADDAVMVAEFRRRLSGALN